MIETVAVGVMLVAAYLAYGTPAGVIDALGAGDLGALRSLALSLAIPLAVGGAIVRWSGDSQD